MSLKKSFYVSILFYSAVIILLIIAKSNTQDIIPLKIQKGSVGDISFFFANKEDGMNQKNSIQNTATEEGTIAEEISKIQNKISYPPQALEDNLESECEWKLVINELHKASQIQTLRPCKYKIFEAEFRQVIENWDFNLPSGTILEIPVNFKIK